MALSLDRFRAGAVYGGLVMWGVQATLAGAEWLALKGHAVEWSQTAAIFSLGMGLLALGLARRFRRWWMAVVHTAVLEYRGGQ